MTESSEGQILQYFFFVLFFQDKNSGEKNFPKSFDNLLSPFTFSRTE